MQNPKTGDFCLKWVFSIATSSVLILQKHTTWFGVRAFSIISRTNILFICLKNTMNIWIRGGNWSSVILLPGIHHEKSWKYWVIGFWSIAQRMNWKVSRFRQESIPQRLRLTANHWESICSSELKNEFGTTSLGVLLDDEFTKVRNSYDHEFTNYWQKIF